MNFIQYMRPDGRAKSVTIGRSPEIEDKARALALAGYRLECEVLLTEEVSLTVESEEATIAIEVIPNGPGVPDAVDRLICAAFGSIATGATP